MVIKLNVVIREVLILLNFIQNVIQHYPIKPNSIHTHTELLGFIGADLNVTDQLLIRFFACHDIEEKIGVQSGNTSPIYIVACGPIAK
jgi:hypothetical protein